MSRLSELYETIKKLEELGLSTSTLELDPMVSNLEEEYWQAEVLPKIKEAIEPALTEFRRGVCIVIEYEPGQPMKAYRTRKTSVKAEAIRKAPTDYTPAQGDSESEWPTHSTKAKTKRLRVTFPDGRVVQDSMAVSTLASTIRMIGTEAVAKVVEELGLICCRIPVVSKERCAPNIGRQRDLGDGWLLMTHSSTHAKKDFLDLVSHYLGLNLIVEYV